MSGRYANGFDWMAAGATTTVTVNQLQSEGWYFEGDSPAVSGWTLTPQTPGRYGFGNRLQFGGTTSTNRHCALLRATGAHNSAGGWLSTGHCVTSMPDPNLTSCLGVYDAANNFRHITVSFAANGVIKAFRGNGLGNPSPGTLLGASDPGSYLVGTQFDVECFMKVHSSTGEVEVRIDGVSKLHLVNVNTQVGSSAYFDSFFIGWDQVAVGATLNFWFDDLRYYDTDGSANNSWLGTCRVQGLLTAGDGGTLNFTRSNTGVANYLNIRNQAIDDTLYLYDPTVGEFNLSTLQPLVNSPTVFWVQVTGFYRQDDATQRYAKNRIVSGAATTDGASFATPQTYAADSDTLELDPNTGLAFTGGAVNALQIGPLVFA